MQFQIWQSNHHQYVKQTNKQTIDRVKFSNRIEKLFNLEGVGGGG